MLATRGPDEAELIAALPVAMLVLDPDGRVARANGECEALLNRSERSMLGQPVDAVLTLPEVESRHEGHAVAAFDAELQTSRGRVRVDLIEAEVPDHPGWRAITLHNAATRRLVHDRAAAARSAVGAAAMLAHEIKNPLSGIRGAAQLLETGADEGGRAMTTLIRDEVDRIAALIDRMEGFTDTRALEVGPQNIHAILGHVRDVATQGFAAGRVMREVYDPSLPAVLGHRDALIQILLNLVKNAVEATEDMTHTPITLTTAYRHGMSTVARDRSGRRVMLPIEVCVIDEGPGAPDAVGDHLFDPFVSSKRRGGGLGLALVDKLVGDLGGAVEYRREGMPPRTVFRLLLPRVAA